MNHRTDLDRIREAVAGQRGDDQRAIAIGGLDVTDLLLRKNHDYGGSAWKRPLLAPGLDCRTAIQCRMSDKVERLARLLGDASPEVAESIEDTVRDLAGYCILWLAAPTAPKPTPFPPNPPSPEYLPGRASI